MTMKNWITFLGGLLIVQIVLVIGVSLGREDYGAFEPQEKLLSFDAEALDSIRIDGEGDEHVVLEKHEGRWQLPDLGAFPADQGSVERLLGRLANLEKGWPVADTATAAKRFKVAEEVFERRLTLSKDGQTEASLYVGTSPGFRKVHVRVPDEDAVYAVEFSAFEAGVKPEDWIDKAILAREVDDIQHAEMANLSVQREDGKITVAGLAEGEETREDEARQLLERIARLRVRSVLGTENKPEYAQDKPALSVTVTLRSGQTDTYVFSRPKDADYYVLKTSLRNEYFQVDPWIVDSIKETTRDKLVRSKAEEPTTGDVAAAPPAGEEAAGAEEEEHEDPDGSPVAEPEAP
jgi:hypothetical protein